MLQMKLSLQALRITLSGAMDYSTSSIKLYSKILFQKRSEAVATYALCGYSNIGSIGINLGALLAFAPSRRVDAPRLVVRAMICGSAACFLTGAVAGGIITYVNQ